MGSSEGDKLNKTGNEMRTFTMQMLQQIGILSIPIIYYYFCYLDLCYVSFFDYILVLMALIGTSLRLWAYKTLGDFFTFEIGIRDEHKLITWGPYAYFTHPGYIGMIITYIGFILFHHTNFLLSMLYMICLMVLFFQRVNPEEKMLTDTFGERYTKYYNSTLMPILMSRNGAIFFWSTYGLVCFFLSVF